MQGLRARERAALFGKSRFGAVSGSSFPGYHFIEEISSLEECPIRIFRIVSRENVCPRTLLKRVKLYNTIFMSYYSCAGIPISSNAWIKTDFFKDF